MSRWVGILFPWELFAMLATTVIAMVAIYAVFPGAPLIVVGVVLFVTIFLPFRIHYDRRRRRQSERLT